MEKSQMFWQTYLNLEKEFLEVAKYIYITDEITYYSNGALIISSCKTQLETHSPFIADLLLRTCVEIEAISKELYFDLNGDKKRGDKDIFFDEDCLKLLDKKYQTHKKVVVVSCSVINLKREGNVCFKPLREAHKRQGTDWERAYQAVKHDRYSSISQGTVKNLLHAMGALYLLNIYLKKPTVTSNYSNMWHLDLSFGSAIFSVRQPDSKYVTEIINNRDVTGVMRAEESPFILKYTDDAYKQILDMNSNMNKEMHRYWCSQPEQKNPEFIQQIKQAQERERINPQDKYVPFYVLAQYRLRKKIPESLPFEEKKKRFISSPEWNGMTRQINHHLNEDQLTEDNIQTEINEAGKFFGIDMLQPFDTMRINKAYHQALCELVLDTGDVKYKDNEQS